MESGFDSFYNITVVLVQWIIFKKENYYEKQI